MRIRCHPPPGSHHTAEDCARAAAAPQPRVSDKLCCQVTAARYVVASSSPKSVRNCRHAISGSTPGLSIVEQLVLLAVRGAVAGEVWFAPAATAKRNHTRLYYRTSVYLALLWPTQDFFLFLKVYYCRIFVLGLVGVC